jgi:hypothetical protein
MRVTRYYCPTAHASFSLLPDCLASRFPSDLDDLERVVTQVTAARSIEAAADTLRLDIDLPSAVRWLRRRLTLVRAALVIVAGVLPGLCARDASLVALGEAWGTDRVLVTLRGRLASHLAVLPPPLGVGPRIRRRPCRDRAVQHGLGAARAGPSDGGSP